MTQFKAGDRVLRMKGQYHGMHDGMTDTVVGVVKRGDNPGARDGLRLETYGDGHDPRNFVLFDGKVKGPIGDPDDSPVSHPKHYNSHPSGIECIEIVRHHNFNIGNAIKYLWRLGLKGKKATSKKQRLQEIDKAIFYLQDERARIEAEA